MINNKGHYGIRGILEDGPLWDSKSPYTAGAFVSHNGSVYVAVSSNVNSEPSSGNANWDEVLHSGNAGTAAYANLTTSPTDTTADRVLKVGDFGLGNSAPPTITDLTGTLFPGFYLVYGETHPSASIGAPVGSSGFAYSAIVSRAAGGTQIILSRNTGGTPFIYVGTRSGATGSIPWASGYTTGNVAASAQNLLANGSYGLGTSGLAAPEDHDDFLGSVNGFYQRGTAGINYPTNFGSIVHLERAIGLRAHSLHFGNLGAEPELDLNYYDGTSWSGWRTVYSTGNATGTIIKRAFVSTGAVISTTSQIAYGDTIPQITEGAEALSIAFTPRRADTRIRIRAVLQLRASTINVASVVALFDGASNALAVAAVFGDSDNANQGIHSIPVVADIPSPVSAIPISARFAPSTTATLYLNGSQSGARIFGGACASTLEVEEYTV